MAGFDGFRSVLGERFLLRLEPLLEIEIAKVGQLVQKHCNLFGRGVAAPKVLG
jgi:hypothetical protein